MGNLVDQIVCIGIVGHLVVCMLMVIDVTKEMCDTPVAIIAMIA